MPRPTRCGPVATGTDDRGGGPRRLGASAARLVLLGLALLLGLPQPARAATSATEEASHTSTFELLRSADLEPALAGELWAPAAPRLLLEGDVDPLPQATRTFTVTWKARERPGLQGYRLTAVIVGGPLSGLAARWHVPAVGSDAPQSYRVRLLLPVAGAPRVRVAIEAVAGGGVGPVLAVRQGAAGTRGHAPATSHWAPRGRSPRASDSSMPRADRRLALLTEQTPPSPEASRRGTDARPGQPTWRAADPHSRGPPSDEPA